MLIVIKNKHFKINFMQSNMCIIFNERERKKNRTIIVKFEHETVL